MPPTRPPSKPPALRGGLLALSAALLFGLSAPLTQRLGVGVGPFTTAALLYGGAAFAGLLSRRPRALEAKLRTADLPRVVWMAAFGAALAPAALAWGLQRSSGTGGSLMLTLEALFTALLARVFYGESLGRRVWAAMAMLTAGAAALVLDQGLGGTGRLAGLLAVLLATAAWGVDNALSRAVADRDPGEVVLAKALLGCGATALLARAWVEPMPTAGAAWALLAVGASGYGLSLRLYLLAQRAFGAARTGSVFAFAPFIGAAAAFAMGEREASWLLAAGGLLMLMGVLLHLTESHDHAHTHEAVSHEHAHRHDDGHHDHWHAVMPRGAHSHPHSHEPVTHAHPHAPDIHHGHSH